MGKKEKKQQKSLFLPDTLLWVSSNVTDICNSVDQICHFTHFSFTHFFKKRKSPPFCLHGATQKIIVIIIIFKKVKFTQSVYLLKDKLQLNY